MAVIVQLRRGDAEEWTSHNPTLAPGELGVELDTGRFKVGDGATAWASLAYASGDDGSIWLVDDRDPAEGDGVDGDLFLRTDTGDVFWKDEGSWGQVANLTGPAGPDGSPGDDGSVWYAGEGAPDGGLGTVGDYYLDTDTGDVYFTDGSWAVVGNIQGPDGPEGPEGPQGETTGAFDGGYPDSVYVNQIMDGGVEE